MISSWGGATVADKQVIIISSRPARPATPTVSSNVCGTRTLTRGTPPSGVTWYWQGTNINGNSTSNSSSTYQVSASGTYYLVAKTNGAYYWSSKVGVSVTYYPGMTAGSISGSRTVCSGSAAPLIRSQSLPAGGSGSYTYQWQVSYNNTSWTPASGTNTGSSYNPPGTITQRTYYRRKVTSNCGSLYSNTVTISVYNTLTAGGSIGGNQTVCTGDASPQISSQSLPTGGTGTYLFQWQVSYDNMNWTLAPGANMGASYDPSGAVTQRTYYRRKVFSCGSLYSNTVTISVYSNLTAGSIGGNQTACPGVAAPLISSQSLPTGGSGSYTYQWQVSYNNTNWTPAPGTNTGASYDPPGTITQQTYYRRRVTSNCRSRHSNTVTISVYNSPTAGSISGNRTVCPGSAAPLISSQSLPSGGSGSYTYQWQVSYNNTNWTPASGTNTGAGYDPPGTITQRTYYRRRVTSNCGSLYSNTVTISVHNSITAGMLSGNTEFCQSGTVNLTLSGSSQGVLKAWQRNTGSGFVNISSQPTGDNLSEPALNGYQYRVAFFGSCGTLYSNTKTVSISTSSLAGSIAPSRGEFWGSASGQVKLSSHTGQVTKWQKRAYGGSWQDVSSSAGVTDLPFTSLDRSTDFRALITNGSCPSIWSATAQVTVNQTGFEGYITGDDMVIDGGSGTLRLEGYQGEILRWQHYSYSHVSDRWRWRTVSSTSSTITFSQLDGDRLYRAVVNFLGTQGYSAPFRVKWFAQEPDHNGENYTQVTQVKVPRTDPLSVDGLTVAQGEKVVQRTYYDGLGRDVQQVAEEASASGKDVVSFMAYDAFGRSPETWLPFTTTGSEYYSNASTGQAAFYTSHYPGETPYAQTVYESSPLQRVIEQGAPGADWQPGSGHTVRYGYGYNVADEVRYWKADGTTNSYYAAYALYKNTVTDENDHKVVTYTDSEGLTILKKVEADAGQYLDTYMIHDKLGRLLYTLPPKAVELLGSGSTFDANSSTVADLIYTYVYDDKGRLVERKVPGKAVEYIVYDPLDRPVLTQDGLLRQHNQWFFSKHDRLERPVYSGIYTNNTQTTRAAVQALFDALDYDGADLWYEETATNATYQGYTNQAFPTSGLQVLQISYYDHYDFDRDGTADYSYDNTQLAGQETAAFDRIRGRATGGGVRMLDTNQWLYSAVFYDDYGRVIQTHADNHKGSTDKATVVYDFSGQVLATQSEQNGVTVHQGMSYDHAGRLLEITHSVNGAAPVTLAAYTYNEFDQLSGKSLHQSTPGGSYFQAVDYAYTIRGWLKSINDPDQLPTDRLFGMELLYNGSLAALGQTPAYNGNITAIKWKNNLVANSQTKAYAYEYDKADRLKEAGYGSGAGFTQNAQHHAVTAIDYDANGNIENLTRQAPDPMGGAMSLDDLTYSYSGNQVTAVHDTGNTTEGFADNASGTTYAYDVNGNLASDAHKGITSVTYNILNKPAEVVFNDGRTLKYIYSADGIQRARELYENNSLITTTDYLAGAVYEDDVLQFLSHPEGRIVYTPSDGSFDYQYAYTDHLGNIRLVYTADPGVHTFRATMETEAGEQQDDALFSNLSAGDRPTHPSATSHNQVYRLLPGTVDGPGISIPVYPGDVIDMSVQGFYGNGNGNSTVNTTALVAAVASIFGGANGGNTSEQAIYNSFDNAINPAMGGFGLHSPSNNEVAAYLNYIIFDKDMNVAQYGHWAMDDAATGAAMLMQMQPAPVSSVEGFVYVYLTNESNAEVYYDDFEVTVHESPVVQCTDYYPFGLQFSSSWTRVTDLKNTYLYNQGSELNEQTGNYETFYRQYDPAIGRFHGIDPLAAKYSSLTPYNYALNDPIALNDPMGDDAIGDMMERMGRPRRGYSRMQYPEMQLHKDGRGGGSYTGVPGSGYHWIDAYRSVEANLGMMTTSTFRDFYGLNDGYGGTNYERAGQLANELASGGNADITRYSIGVNGLGDGNGNIIPGTEIYVLYVDAQSNGGSESLASTIAIPVTGSGVAGSGLAGASSIPAVGAGILAAYGIDVLERKASEKTFVTYTKIGPNGQVYVGRASGTGTPLDIVKRRDVGHHMNAFGFGPAILDQFAMGTTSVQLGMGFATSLSAYVVIRGREQQLIDFYGGSVSDGNLSGANAIRGVSKWNPLGRVYHAGSSAVFGQIAPYTGY